MSSNLKSCPAKKKNISIKLMWHSHFRHLQCTHEKKHIFQVFKPAESHIDCWKGWFQTKSCLCLENKYEICYFMRIYIHLLKVSYCFFRLKNWPNPANTLLCIKHHEKRSSWSLMKILIVLWIAYCPLCNYTSYISIDIFDMYIYKYIYAYILI